MADYSFADFRPFKIVCRRKYTQSFNARIVLYCNAKSEERLYSPFNKSTNPIKVSSWRPNHLPKSPPPNTELSSCRLDFNIWILRCHKHTKHSKHLGLTQASETLLWVDFTGRARKWSFTPFFWSFLLWSVSHEILSHPQLCVLSLCKQSGRF